MSSGIERLKRAAKPTFKVKEAMMLAQATSATGKKVKNTPATAFNAVTPAASTKKSSKGSKKKSSKGTVPATPATVTLAVPTKKRSSKKGALLVPIAPEGTPRLLPGLWGVGTPLLLSIAEYLKPLEVLKFAFLGKHVLEVFQEKQASIFWRSMLYGPSIDAYGVYEESVPLAHREAVESHFGCMRVVSALVVPKCGSCGGYASHFNVLACARSCESCWSCGDGGENGRGSASPYAICSQGFANTHFLITDGQVKNGEIFSLNVEDPTLAHGLMGSKMTIMLVRDAKRLAVKKWSSMEDLEAEKHARWGASSAQKPMTPTAAEKQTNFLCRNQRSYEMRSVATIYGFSRDIMVPDMLTQPPSIFLTTDTLDQVKVRFPELATSIFQQESKYSIQTNIVEAFSLAHRRGGCTVLVDMRCDINAAFASCDKALCDVAISRRNHYNIGGENADVQTNTIHLMNDVKIVGTSRGSVVSSTACFWTHESVMVEIQNLTMITRMNNISPTLVLNGYSCVEDCEITNGGGGYAALMHGRSSKMFNCTISVNALSLHVSSAKPFPVSIQVRGCEITQASDEHPCFFDENHDDPVIKAWLEQFDKDNQFEFAGNDSDNGYDSEGYGPGYCQGCGGYH